MAVEIGSLVVRGTFGQARHADDERLDVLEERVAQLRRALRLEMREMLAEAERRAREP